MEIREINGRVKSFRDNLGTWKDDSGEGVAVVDTSGGDASKQDAEDLEAKAVAEDDGFIAQGNSPQGTSAQALSRQQGNIINIEPGYRR